MSDTANSIAELSKNVVGAVSEIRNAHTLLNAGIEKLTAHASDAAAHGLDNPASPMRKNIEEIAINALDSGTLDERIRESVSGEVQESLATALPEAVAEKLPSIVQSEFSKNDSVVLQAVANKVETIISDKIESGEINGGSGNNQKPVTPDKPVDPEPDQPDTPDNPDDPQPPAVGKAGILSPAHGATGLDIPFSVTISDFAVTNDGEDTAKAVQLQVASDSKFENIVFDSGQIAPTKQIAVTSGVSFNEVVYLRARYIGNTLGEGPWSTFVGVTTRSVLIESDDFWDIMPDPTGECTITDFGAEPELTLSLNGGPMYEAPAIDGAEIWRSGGTVFIRLAQAAGMSINPAVKYEVFVTGDETLREIEADAEGFAQFSFILDGNLSAPAKELVAAVAIDADGNRSAIARRVFRAVPKSHPLCANSLEEGTDFPAPVIDCKSFWKREARVTMTVAPAPDSAIPARYEAFAEGFGNIVSVNADAEGKATIGITLPASVQGETKILVRVAPVASSGRHGKAASKVLNIVSSDITLMPEFVFPDENAPINKGNVVFQLNPFATLCGDVAEKQDGARYRILDATGATVFDSGILTQAANFDRYAAYAPDLPDDPGLEYTLQARVRGSSLGWSEWASRKVTISQVASPVFTSPANGASFIWGGGIPCETSELALPAGGFDTHISSDWKLCYDNLGLDVICEELDSPDLTSHVIVPEDVRDGANCFAFCRHKAQTAGLSAWSVPVMVKTSSGGVNQAVISGPAPDSTISVNDAGVTATSAAFGTDGLNDAHIASDWKICADINGNSALVQALDSADLLAHAFSVADCASLANGTVYYLFTRHKGGRLDWGPWSEPVAFTAKKAGVNAATVASPAAGATIVFNDTGITLTTNAFSVDGAADTHAATDWKITSDIAGANVVLEAMASADKLSHLFTAAQCAALADGATLYAFARHSGARFGYGPWSAPVALKMKKGVVNTPSILTPTQNASILVMDDSLAVTASAFGVNAGTDTHSKTDWKLTSDAAGNNIIQQALNSADKTAHTFSGLGLGAAINTVYLWTRQHGTKFGASAWSAARAIRISTSIKTSNGNDLWRHGDNNSCVFGCTVKGVKTYLRIWDAQYRTTKQWGTYGTDTSLPNCGSATDANTAKYNTDVLVGYSDTEAAKYCRTLGADLGTIDEMLAIFADRAAIDAIDPTVASYPNNKLSNWGFGASGGTYCWSSSENYCNRAWCVHSGGSANNLYRSNVFGVVPLQDMLMALALKDHYTYADFLEAYLDCRRRKRRTPKQLQFEMRLEDNLALLMDEVNAEKYRIGASRAFTIMKPKPREIWAAQFRDRIVHHLLYNDMGAYFERRFIEDTYSCIPGRGALAAMQRAQKFMRKVSENFARPAFFLQADIRNFFVSIDRNLLWELVRAHSGDASLGARLARQVILHDPTSNAIIKPGSDFGRIPPHKSLWRARPGHGLPIGNLTSQFLSNVYLDGFDQFVKHTLKVRFYLRYVDDVVFFSQDRGQLWHWLAECDNWLKKWRGLMFHPDKSLVAPVSQGLDFVGWIILPWRVYPRRRTVAAAKASRDNPASMASYTGIFKHCNAYKLTQKLSAQCGLGMKFPVHIGGFALAKTPAKFPQGEPRFAAGKI